MIYDQRVAGVLTGMRPGEFGSDWGESDVRFLEIVAGPLAAAIVRARHIEEAERLLQIDDLTKLHNARYLGERLVSEIKRARRYDSFVSLLFLDLDNFKSINDVHGHLVGSHVLVEMAGAILASVRDTDVVARYGGDEFVVLLPETALDRAAHVAERIRTKLNESYFTGGRRLRLRITASFGVAAYPVHALSPQQLIIAADSAMYVAKAARKNCVRLAGESTGSAGSAANSTGKSSMAASNLPSIENEKAAS